MNIYGLAPITGATHWYRIREPLRGLAGIGHTTEFGELFDESIVTRHDTILTHLLHGEIEGQAWAYLAEAGQHRLVYDIDDDVWSYEEGTEHAAYWTRERQQQVEENIRRAWLVTTPSSVLAQKIQFGLGLHDNVRVLPNYVPAWLLDIPREWPERFVVGYQGAPQRIHQSDIDTIQQELFWFLHRAANAELHFLGQPRELDGAGPFADRVKYHPWTPDVPSYYRSLHRMTVGIGPLARNEFTDAKSGLRAIEFAAMGIPGLFTDSPPYHGWVDHRETGYLMPRADPREWRRRLTKLYRSPELVREIANKARLKARDWTTEGNAWRWEEAYELCRPRASLESSTLPVVGAPGASLSDTADGT